MKVTFFGTMVWKILVTCEKLCLVIAEGYSFHRMLYNLQWLTQCSGYLPTCVCISFFLAESVHIFWNFSDEFGSLWAVEWWRNMESCRGGKTAQSYLYHSGEVLTAECSVGQVIVICYIYRVLGNKVLRKGVCYKPGFLIS